jgi:penicillin-binding protein 1A
VVSTLPPIQSLEVPKRRRREIGGTTATAGPRGEMSGTDVSIKGFHHLPKAFVAIGSPVHSHFGADPIRLAAVVANVLRRGVSQGGSTLTQQLARPVPDPAAHARRKMQELVLALWLERKFGRTDSSSISTGSISARRLQRWGRRSTLFRQVSAPVKVGEAAMLAGVVKSPSRLALNRNRRRRRRAQTVLAAMGELSFITETMMKTAQAQPTRASEARGRRLGQLRRRLDHGRADDLVGRIEQDLVVKTRSIPRCRPRPRSR